jgi:hypothetical protein
MKAVNLTFPLYSESTVIVGKKIISAGHSADVTVILVGFYWFLVCRMLMQHLLQNFLYNNIPI